MQRADLVARRIAQIGEVQLAGRALAPARRLFACLAAIRDTGSVPRGGDLGAVAGEADRATVGERRGIAVR
jgi:hypothetical protein